MSARRNVSLIELPEKQERLGLPPCAGAPRVFVSVTPNEVTWIIGVLVVLNVLFSFLLTSHPVPAWLPLSKLASDLDTALLVGTAHIGLACCVILVAARRLFHAHGLSTQLWVMGGIALLGTLLSLGRYWAYPVRTEIATPQFATQPAPPADDVPLHGALPGRR